MENRHAAEIATRQLAASRAESQASLREDQLRQDIAHAQERLQQAESRNQDVSVSMWVTASLNQIVAP